ncbi:MAG: leucyl/phenylalanyl-tRNA--protein transferase [Xanthomonadales bacterium]|nr:leucyl/phenylalanyl-tRNA--protein transferase [Xanthomonadales bacterium]MBK7144789.1 leucyl/phenylalanyl-tRNA--protein transferase [Xanthomonadales bacterium]MCC6562276.1 leucyl/phenylalanyl-tRNA--protein transferase [Xanthomonadales bacterium]
MIRIPILPRAPLLPFPPVEQALDEPNGLLCAGGDLSPERLLLAYRNGIFPWFNDGEPILWWSPDPRAVFDLASTRANARFRRFARSCPWTLRIDRDFVSVIDACAAPRSYAEGTWITAAMRDAYLQLHELGHAHCIAVHDGGDLVGGLYGIAIGRVFCGESMFSRRPNASKLALFALAAWLRTAGFVWLDGQVESGHLTRLGAHTMARTDFVAGLSQHGTQPPANPRWTVEFGLRSTSELTL